MRARDTVGDESTRHGWRRRRSAIEEKRGAKDARLWRRREGLRGGENRQKMREEREQTGKWPERGRQQVASFHFSFFSFSFQWLRFKLLHPTTTKNLRYGTSLSTIEVSLLLLLFCCLFLFTPFLRCHLSDTYGIYIIIH